MYGLKNMSSQNHSILPIHLAAIYRKTESLETLLYSGADPEIRDHFGHTALHLVITHWPSIRGPWPKPWTRFQRAMIAMQQRAEACLRVLCRFGANVNSPVANGCQQTPLHLAVRHGAPSAVAILAGHGANINATDQFGMVPLHMAAGVLDPCMTTSLIWAGADVNKAKRQSGSTALHMAISAAVSKAGKTTVTDLQCISELLSHGALPDSQNIAGRTPLHEACQGGREEVVDMLLQYNANVNMRTASGENCLFLFLDRKSNLCCTTLLRKLLSLTYPFTITDKEGLLPSVLLMPKHDFQRDLLLHLSQQPLSLLDICRIYIRQQYGKGQRETLKDLLPDRLFNFVYSYRDCTSEISFFGYGYQMTTNETYT
ncbi:ankyrin repeat domain-containing protein 61-like [Scleropages formosus]|uniref:Ankyrin repeat domain-containing protein 61-like n=1 Tax=Scleropages formosus TaxID=113540 RepID=A0A0P7UCP6_SCLFO|nr:ankyrin repeat domain-containing protein 61-like [Scleropages formosus]